MKDVWVDLLEIKEESESGGPATPHPVRGRMRQSWLVAGACIALALIGLVAAGASRVWFRTAQGGAADAGRPHHHAARSGARADLLA